MRTRPRPARLVSRRRHGRGEQRGGLHCRALLYRLINGIVCGVPVLVLSHVLSQVGSKKDGGSAGQGWQGRSSAAEPVAQSVPHPNQTATPLALALARRIVGAANAVAAGWGNSAGGFVQLLMPLVLQVQTPGAGQRAAAPGPLRCPAAAPRCAPCWPAAHRGAAPTLCLAQGMARVQPDFIAWRTCYQVVGWMQVVTGVLVSGTACAARAAVPPASPPPRLPAPQPCLHACPPSLPPPPRCCCSAKTCQAATTGPCAARVQWRAATANASTGLRSATTALGCSWPSTASPLAWSSP